MKNWSNDRKLLVQLMKKSLTGYLYSESSYEVLQPYSGTGRIGLYAWLKNVLIIIFNRRNIKLVVAHDQPASDRLEGRGFPFIGYTMISEARLENICAAIESIIEKKVSGSYFEAGVWRGGSCIFAKFLFELIDPDTDRQVFLADSFAGMPKIDLEGGDAVDAPDLSEFDVLRVQEAYVRDGFSRYGLLDSNVHFLKGWFKDTLRGQDFGPIACLRLDADLYASTFEALQCLYHQVEVGGWVIVDDYYDWDECARAVDDFRRINNITDIIHKVDWSCAYWIKGAGVGPEST